MDNLPPPPPAKELRCGCVIDSIVYNSTKNNGNPVIIPVKTCNKHSNKTLTIDDIESFSNLPWMYIGIAVLVILGAVAFYYYGGDMKFITDSVKSVSETVADVVPKAST